jgi:hypothetical protein
MSHFVYAKNRGEARRARHTPAIWKSIIVPQNTVTVAREIAADLDEIERVLTELHADAEAIRFHRAMIRLVRMAWLAHSIAAGLRQQASKLEGRER